jgi:glycerophosphoryl diester phosphodiesterase
MPGEGLLTTEDLTWLTQRPIAHRGYHDAAAGRIENTLPAFAVAVERGFAIECDVRLTADNSVVVFHDATFDRLTAATGPVAGRTLADLRRIAFRHGDARIPTLAALLDLVRAAVPLFLELKADGAERGPVLAAAVTRALAGYQGPVAVMSFEPRAMVAMRYLARALPRGMIVDGFTAADYPDLSAVARFARRHLLAAPGVAPRFLACDARRLPAAAPALLRSLGRPLLAWTVRSQQEWARLERHADQMIFEGFDPAAPSSVDAVG